MKHAPNPKQIASILQEARKAGSTRLVGTRDERLAQLKALRSRDLNQEGRKGVKSQS